MELYAPIHTINPHWEDRNRIIAEMMIPHKTVIDLGCGARNLLKFYKPSKYLGVDGIPSADLIIDLDDDFVLPEGWDYVVNSGILEFVLRPDLYLEKIRSLGNEYFFSWWRGPGWGHMSFDSIEGLISRNYRIEDMQPMGLVNRIYRCSRI